jgi:predicted transposase/invertase (TIGR01784 family)
MKTKLKIQNPHDKLFKETWSNLLNAKSFLENYLPKDILKITQLDSLEICKDTFIEKDLKEYYSDMLYKVKFKEETGHIYFLFEHKSYPESRIHLQLLEYMIKIWRLDLKQNRRLPIIIPLVMYHSPHKWKTGDKFSSILSGPTDLMSEYIPDFKYILYDISRYSDDEIKGTVTARVVMLLFKHIFDQDFPEKLEKIFPLLKDLIEKETGLQYLESLLKYIFSNDVDLSTERIKTIVANTLSKSKGDFVMTLAEKLRQEGRQEGSYDTYYTLIQNMKKNDLSNEEIARLTNIDIDIVKKLINKEQVEIPLHLLNPNS